MCEWCNHEKPSHNTHLSNAEFRRLLRLLLQPNLKALVNNVERDPTEEEVGGAEGGQIHLDEVCVPGAIMPELRLVLRRLRVGAEPLLEVRVEELWGTEAEAAPRSGRRWRFHRGRLRRRLSMEAPYNKEGEFILRVLCRTYSRT